MRPCPILLLVFFLATHAAPLPPLRTQPTPPPPVVGTAVGPVLNPPGLITVFAETADRGLFAMREGSRQAQTALMQYPRLRLAFIVAAVLALSATAYVMLWQPLVVAFAGSPSFPTRRTALSVAGAVLVVALWLAF